MWHGIDGVRVMSVVPPIMLQNYEPRGVDGSQICEFKVLPLQNCLSYIKKVTFMSSFNVL